LLQQVDVLRRPQRLQMLISILHCTGEVDVAARQFFVEAETAYRSVKAQDIIAEGIKGAAIKVALQQRQEQALAQWLGRA
jgi:hypothetical protein